MNYPVSVSKIELFIDKERFLPGKAWNAPIPTATKKVRVRHNGIIKDVSISHMGDDTFTNGKKMQIWRIDLDYKYIISSTYQCSNRHRSVGPFNFYMIKRDKGFELYKGPQEFAILECLA